MKEFLILTATIVLGLVATTLPIAADVTTRVVSLLPSATETIYALEAEDALVGVTRFCRFPPEAQEKPRVGGLLDVNYEAIVRADPSVVILEINAVDVARQLKKLGVIMLEVETRSVDGILQSFQQIGAVVDQVGPAQAMVDDIRSRIRKIQTRTANATPPSVMVTFLRPVGEGVIRDVYIAGQNSYFNELIELAGGRNVYEGHEAITSPVLNAEGILRLDPEIIIEVMGQFAGDQATLTLARSDWDMLQELQAYRSGRIHILADEHIGIPGPRFVDVLEEFARLLHPDAIGKDQP